MDPSTLSDIFAGASVVNPLDTSSGKYVRHVSVSGEEYFADATTGDTVWKKDLPEGAQIVDNLVLTTEEGDTEKANPLLMGNPRTYVRHLSSSGREYFADPITGATLWKEDLPGGAHIVDKLQRKSGFLEAIDTGSKIVPAPINRWKSVLFRYATKEQYRIAQILFLSVFLFAGRL